jgi:uncharacterized protein (DUF1501 family)
MNMNRRAFLRLAAQCGLGGVAAATVLEKFALMHMALGDPPTGDTRYLICIFLNGGNDGNNMLVPLNGATGFPTTGVAAGVTYTAYANARQAQGLAYPAPPATGAEPAGSLLRINPQLANLGMFGLHPNMGIAPVSGTGGVVTPAGAAAIPSFKAQYDAGKIAWINNVGTLIRPINNKADYQSSATPKPSQLFSHSDQISQNQTCLFTSAGGTGWLGRTNDVINGPSFPGGPINGYVNPGLTPPLSDPSGTRLPMGISISGNAALLGGVANFPLVMATYNRAQATQLLNSAFVLSGYTDPNATARRTAFNNLLTSVAGHPDMGKNKLVDALSGITEKANQVAADLGVAPQLRVPGSAGPGLIEFPNTTLGNQLQQVARMIKANLTQPRLNLRRLTFFTARGGFDTHQNQQAGGGQPALLQEVAQAIACFMYWAANDPDINNGTIIPAGDSLLNRCVLFQLSDFNRTMNPAGTGGTVGTDHAWGSHFFLAGGQVNGGRFFGNTLPGTGSNGSVFPDLRITSGVDLPAGGNAYDTDTRGRWIATTGTQQYANTLARWFGLPQDNPTLDAVFAGLRTNFPTVLLPGVLP